jgi:hypothetical protein
MGKRPVESHSHGVLGDRRAWLAMAFEDDTSPYNDQAGISYDYDSNVQNHKQVSQGDLLFVRSRTSLKGVGRIGWIEKTIGEKIVARCPACGVAIAVGRQAIKGSSRCKKGPSFYRATAHAYGSLQVSRLLRRRLGRYRTCNERN